MRRSHRFPVQDREDRILQLTAARCRVPHAACDVLVVDPAVVTDLSLVIQDERLGGHGRADLAGERAVTVACDPEFQPEVLHVGPDFGIAQVRVYADSNPLHRSLPELGHQLIERGAVGVGDRAFRGVEHHHRGPIGRRRQRNSLVVQTSQCRILEDRWRPAPRGSAQSDQRQETAR